MNENNGFIALLYLALMDDSKSSYDELRSDLVRLMGEDILKQIETKGE